MTFKDAIHSVMIKMMTKMIMIMITIKIIMMMMYPTGHWNGVPDLC